MSVELDRVEEAFRTPIIPAAPGALPTQPYVSLTEALTWIAFGVPLDTQEFYEADERGSGPFSDRVKLCTTITNAMARFSEKAAGGLLEVRGRYITVYCDHLAVKSADTRTLRKEELRDFGRFDSLYGGLERGKGATWEASPLDRILHEKGDGWRDVEVARESLEKEFEPGTRLRPTHEAVVSWCESWLKQNKRKGQLPAWKVFRALPAHAGLSRDDVFRPAFKDAKTKLTP